jgi:uncharacterized membrane protein YidH (DUF202 family)
VGVEREPAPDALLEDEELPGLAGERTDLAWSRSGISVLAAVGVVLKQAVDGFDLQSATAIVLAGLVAVAVAGSAALVYAQSLAETTLAGRSLTSPQRLRRVSQGTTLFGLAAVVLSFVTT